MPMTPVAGKKWKEKGEGRGDTELVKTYSEVEITRWTLQYRHRGNRFDSLEKSFYKEHARNVRSLFRWSFFGVAAYQVTVGIAYDIFSFMGSGFTKYRMTLQLLAIVIPLRLTLAAGSVYFVYSVLDVNKLYLTNQRISIYAWIAVSVFIAVLQVIQRSPSEGITLLLITCLFNMTPIRAPLLSLMATAYTVFFGVGIFLLDTPEDSATIPCEPTSESSVDLKLKTLGSCFFLVYLFSTVTYQRQETLMQNHLLIYQFQVQKRLLDTQRALTEGILNSLWPPAVMEEIRSKDTPEIVTTYSDVTVLFCIIDKFDEIGDKLNATEVVELLNVVFSKFDELCDSHDIYKIETVGQVYLAVSGCPERNLRNHKNAAEMALSMVAALPYIRKRLHKALGRDKGELFRKFTIKVGLECGAVVGGVVGRSSPRFKLIGDTVNTASRMESTARPGTIQVTSSVYKKLKGLGFLFMARDPFNVKGKGIMQTYLLQGRDPKFVEKVKNYKPKNTKQRRVSLFTKTDRQSLAGKANRTEVAHLKGHARQQHRTIYAGLKGRRAKSVSLDLVLLYVLGDKAEVQFSEDDARAEVAFRVRLFANEVARLRLYSVLVIVFVPCYVVATGYNTGFDLGLTFIVSQLICFFSAVYMLCQTVLPNFVRHHQRTTLIVAAIMLIAVTYVNAESGESSGYGFNALCVMVMYLTSNITLFHRFLLAICMAIWYFFILTVSNTSPGIQKIDSETVFGDYADEELWGDLCPSLLLDDGEFESYEETASCTAWSCLDTASYFTSQMLETDDWEFFTEPPFLPPGDVNATCPLVDAFMGNTTDFTLCNAWDKSVRRWMSTESGDDDDYRYVTKEEASFGLVWLLLFSLILLFPVFIADYHIKLTIIESEKTRRQDEQIHDETSKYKEWLDKLLPPSVVGEMVAKKPIVHEFPRVTVLFADLVGFTKFSASVTATELVTFLNNLYAAFDVVLNEYGMYRVEIIGDALFAVAGCPQEYVDPLHALRAVNTAHGLLREMEKINIEAARVGRKFNLRVGIHTGPVVGAVVGKKDPRYHVFGATVTKAELMEQTSMPGHVHCSKEAFAAISEHMEGRYKGMLRFEERSVLKRGEHSYFVDLERKVPLPPLRSGRLEQAPSRLSLPTLHSPSGSSAPPKFPRASKAASESKSATITTPRGASTR